MALSLLVACSRSAQLALVSMKRTSAALIRLLLALVLPFALALLLPRLLSFLFSLAPLLSSLLHPAPIFVLANILVLAIILSSPSSQSMPHETSFATRFHNPLTYADDASPYYPCPDLALQRWHASEPASSDLSKPLVAVSVPFGRQCDVFCASSRRTFSKSTTQLSQKYVAATNVDANIKQLVTTERSSEQLQLTKQLSVKEPAEYKVAVSGGIVRSDSDSRICADGHATACEKAIRRTVTMSSASVVLRAACNGKSSSMIVMDVPPIESLIDEDFQKRCAEFIANNYQNWKKESLNSRS